MKARQGSDRFLTWLQETKGLEVRALSLTKARNGGLSCKARNELLVRRKVWQGMVGLRLVLFGGKERMSYSTLFFSPYIASAGWAPNNHPITSRKLFTCWVQLNILLGDWIM